MLCGREKKTSKMESAKIPLMAVTWLLSAAIEKGAGL